MTLMGLVSSSNRKRGMSACTRLFLSSRSCFRSLHIFPAACQNSSFPPHPSIHLLVQTASTKTFAEKSNGARSSPSIIHPPKNPLQRRRRRRRAALHHKVRYGYPVEPLHQTPSRSWARSYQGHLLSVLVAGAVSSVLRPSFYIITDPRTLLCAIPNGNPLWSAVA